MFSDVNPASCRQFYAMGAHNYFIIALFPIFIATTLWIRRQPPFHGKRFFLIANWALIVWLLAVALELFSVTPACKIFWGMLAYSGIDLLPVAWFLFVYRYTRGETGKVLPWQWAIIIALPTFGTLAALASPYTGLFYTSESGPATTAIGAPIHYVYGPLFYINAAVLYCLILASFILLGIGVSRTTGIARLLCVLLMTMTALPSAANFGYITFGINIAGFDPTPFLFSFVLLAYAMVLSLSKFFQISNIAKDMIFDSLPTAVVVLSSDGRILTFNQHAQKLMLKLKQPNPVVWDIPMLADLMTIAVSGENLTTPPEVKINAEFFEVGMTPIHDNRQSKIRPVIGFVFVFFEVTKRKQVQVSLAEALDQSGAQLDQVVMQNRLIAQEVRTDPLTGLLNRRSLSDEFQRMTDAKAKTVFAVLVDIDHFKSINDRLGHGVGDEVLIALATCLQRSFREKDRVFRLGGEEFLILLTDVDLQALYSRIAQLRHLTTLAGELLLPNDMHLQFSAGVATWPTDAENLPTLLDRADKRLYAAKQAGRNRTKGPLAETG